MQKPYRKYRMTIYVTDQWTAGGNRPQPKRLRKKDVIEQVEQSELAGLYITVDKKSFELLEDREYE